MAQRPISIANVKPVTFERFFIAVDGESMIFQVKDAEGNIGHISIEWDHLGTANQVFDRAAEKCGERRGQLGKTNLFSGKERAARRLQTFHVSEFPDQNLMVLSLQDSSGLRCDFAFETNTQDQLGRPLRKAIAEELLRGHA
jgi:hypothetical protein